MTKGYERVGMFKINDDGSAGLLRQKEYTVKIYDHFGHELFMFLIRADDEEQACEKAQEALLKEVEVDIINEIRPL